MPRRWFLRLLFWLLGRLLVPGLGFFGSPFASSSKTVFSTGIEAYWNQVAEPRCYTYSGTTFVNFVRQNLHLYAMQIPNATRTASTPVDFGAVSNPPDGIIHSEGAIIIRDSDKRVLYAEQNDFNPAQPAWWFSTNPADATAFGGINLTGTSYNEPTYAVLAQCTAIANEPIYWFFRVYDSGAATFYVGYIKSTDGGNTWSAHQRIIKPVATSATYYTIFTNGTNRIDIFTTDTNRTIGNPSSVYHMYLDPSTDTLYKSDGTSIGLASGGPYFANTGTLVQGTGLGPARTDGWAYSGGNPCGLVVVNSGGTDSLVRCAVWNGSSWVVNAVTNAGGIVSSNVFQTSGAMVHSDPYTIFTPNKVGSIMEMFKYTSSDAGSTWTGTALTTASAHDNLLPACPSNASAGIDVLWPQGTYTSDSAFSCTLYGYG